MVDPGKVVCVLWVPLSFFDAVCNSVFSSVLKANQAQSQQIKLKPLPCFRNEICFCCSQNVRNIRVAFSGFLHLYSFALATSNCLCAISSDGAYPQLS